MKRSTKRLTILLLTGALFAGAGTALAYGGSHAMGDCGRGGAAAMRAVYHLDNLTSEQKTRLDALRTAQRTAMRAQMDNMRDTREKLRTAMDSNDQAAIAQLAKQTGDQVAAMIIARAQARQQLDSILTEEQRQEFRQGMEDTADCRPQRW